VLHIADSFRNLFNEIGFTPEQIFTNPQIKPWRKLSDRENCTWDIAAQGHTLRLHVKRFPKLRQSPAKIEAEGYHLLQKHEIPAPEVAAWGTLPDGRSFIAMPNLTGYTPADKLIQSGILFDRLLLPTARLAAQLHNANLHHRDLYLCHFMAREQRSAVDLKLIDAARVRKLPGQLTRRRWVIKDLSQFWYSTTQLPITDDQRIAWLHEYAHVAKIPSFDRLRSSIIRKSNAIAAHDQRIRSREPGRNISIPK
jgi:hypothetical protein